MEEVHLVELVPSGDCEACGKPVSLRQSFIYASDEDLEARRICYLCAMHLAAHLVAEDYGIEEYLESIKREDTHDQNRRRAPHLCRPGRLLRSLAHRLPFRRV